MATIKFVKQNTLLSARQCIPGVVYMHHSKGFSEPRAVMFVNGEDVNYSVIDDDTGECPDPHRVGIYLDSGQLEGFHPEGCRFEIAGQIECS